MSLIVLLLYIAVLGFVVYLITLIPMPSPFRQVIIGVAIVVLLLWLIQQLSGGAGLWGGVEVPHLVH